MICVLFDLSPNFIGAHQIFSQTLASPTEPILYQPRPDRPSSPHHARNSASRPHNLACRSCAQADGFLSHNGICYIDCSMSTRRFHRMRRATRCGLLQNSPGSRVRVSKDRDASDQAVPAMRSRCTPTRERLEKTGRRPCGARDLEAVPATAPARAWHRPAKPHVVARVIFKPNTL